LSERSIRLDEHNLATLMVAGRPLYLVKTPDAAAWAYDLPIRIPEIAALRFKRHLLMYETHGHAQALELEVSSGAAPARADLLGKRLVQP
jgi:hypothetical protein